MIDFRSKLLRARRLEPGSDEETEVGAEVRWDPLTGRTARLTISRPLLPTPPPVRGSEMPDLDLDRSRCPFCQDLVQVTPGLAPALSPDRHMRRGEATLFPNLYPYGCYGAVISLTEEHHVPIERFTLRQVRDGLTVARDYLRRVAAHDAEARYVNVTWNLLPAAGGTIIHPHFQVNADPVPVNSLRETQEASRRFRERHGQAYWPLLVAKERRLRMRFLADVGDTAWLVPFAPQAHVEVWGVVPDRTRISDLSDEQVGHLAQGLFFVMQAYAAAGRHALNMGLEADEGPSAEPPVRMRVAVRANYRPWYRSDQTHFDVVLEECATVITPERAAAWLRPSFGAPAGVDPDTATV